MADEKDEKPIELGPASQEALAAIGRDVGTAYQRIVKLMEEEVLSNAEFDFWSDATHALLEAMKRLEALAKRVA